MLEIKSISTLYLRVKILKGNTTTIRSAMIGGKKEEKERQTLLSLLQSFLQLSLGYF
jgi:hypothetical protein